jgi:type I restriction-modification system DNA methylase subunit
MKIKAQPGQPPSDQQAAFLAVQSLCANFQKYETRYLSPQYSEAQARTDFIDHLFFALGWDVSHRVQRNPFEQEVKVEPNVAVAAAQKRADYAFFLAPNFRDVIFYVEAKRPTTNLATSDNYFQTVRYGWNSKTPLAVLTDFRELHILDCRLRPHIDTALQMCILKLSFLELQREEHFAKLYWFFSREAVADNSIEKRVAEIPKRKTIGRQRGLFKGGDQTIDAAFIEDLDRMRDTLARNFKRHNPHLTSALLTEITQRVLDRLVFLRFLEDKLIESTIKVGAFGAKGYPWQEFKAASSLLDQRYNGIVFKPHPIIDNDPTFSVNDDDFGEICAELDDTKSPYNFNVIPIHILGSIYEQFLGKTIVVEGGTAKLEIKPEVRKTGGVYYTPEPIVRYIVERTIGELIANKSPTQISAMKFADIACGSGSFLITVYEELLRYHQRWYNQQTDKDKYIKNRTCIADQDNVLHLSLKTRRNVLLNCIYGVDIDSQAVEVAQLSLYLKLLEEETTASARNYQLEIGGAMLPSLGANIVCGNSLIESAIETDLLAETSIAKRLNVLNFNTAFPWIDETGGFDAIVGNPPWGAQFDEETTGILRHNYVTASTDSIDSYAVFIERARSLLRDRGLLSYIVPDTFLRKDGYLATREMLLAGRLYELIETGPLFSQVRDTWCLVFILSGQTSSRAQIRHHKISRFIVSTEDRLRAFAKRAWDISSTIPQRWWSERSGQVIGYMANMDLQRVIGRLELHTTLGAMQDRFLISRGEEGSKFKIAADSRGRFVMHIPADVKPYSLAQGTRVAATWLTQTKLRDFYSHPKIWITRIQKMRWKQRIVAVFDGSNASAAMKTLQMIVSPTDELDDLKALSGILSSAIVNIWCINYLADDLNQSYLEKIPIPLDGQNPRSVSSLARLVDRKSQFVRALSQAQSDGDSNFYSREVATVTRDIEAAVSRLYGLSDAEMALITSYQKLEEDLQEKAKTVRAEIAAESASAGA